MSTETSMEPLNIESLARAIIETRIEALEQSVGSCWTLNEDGSKRRLFRWDETTETDRQIARIQAKLLLKRILM